MQSIKGDKRNRFLPNSSSIFSIHLIIDWVVIDVINGLIVSTILSIFEYKRVILLHAFSWVYLKLPKKKKQQKYVFFSLNIFLMKKKNKTKFEIKIPTKVNICKYLSSLEFNWFKIVCLQPKTLFDIIWF